MFPKYAVVFLLAANFMAHHLNCAPVEEGQAEVNEGRSVDDEKKNPVQEWFESASKNATISTQNALNNFKDFFTKLIENQKGGTAANTPTMYLGSFQLIKTPMPQMSDVLSQMGNMATLAQQINKIIPMKKP